VNHLAHALIAARTGTSIAGNLMGDFVKGRPERSYDGALLRGIRMHRAVDAFVDAHPAFARSRARFAPALRRWSGILVDLGYDHVLARRWDELGEGTLRSFADRVYAEIAAARSVLPERMRRFAEYLPRADLLAAYREPEEIARALEGMSRRMRKANPLGEAADDVIGAAPGLSADLDELWPALLQAMGAPESARARREPREMEPRAAAERSGGRHA
jgi:acyl carrier protein phosphodiesterase